MDYYWSCKKLQFFLASSHCFLTTIISTFYFTFCIHLHQCYMKVVVVFTFHNCCLGCVITSNTPSRVVRSRERRRYATKLQMWKNHLAATLVLLVCPQVSGAVEQLHHSSVPRPSPQWGSGLRDYLQNWLSSPDPTPPMGRAVWEWDYRL